MKNTIVNIIIFILIFNVMMIVFPEGKTQKYCRLIIKIYIIIYVINNLFFSKIYMLDSLIEDIPQFDTGYEREINVKNVNKEYIDSINEANFGDEEVIRDIIIIFTDDMNIKAKVTVNKYLNTEQISKLKVDISTAFNIGTDNIEIALWNIPYLSEEEKCLK